MPTNPGLAAMSEADLSAMLLNLYRTGDLVHIPDYAAAVETVARVVCKAATSGNPSKVVGEHPAWYYWRGEADTILAALKGKW